MKNSLLLLVAVFAGALWASTEAPLFEEGSHCVAYRAKKTMFLVSSNYVVGKNCDVAAQVLPEVGGLYHIEVNIPLRSFQSGDTTRDEDVAKTLKVDVRPELTFKSQALKAEQWRELFKKPEFEIAGTLTIGNKSFPLKVASHYVDKAENAEVDGIAKVQFQDFEISPPTAGAGIIAKAKSELELHFHLLASRILGADTIRPASEKAAVEPEKEKVTVKK